MSKYVVRPYLRERKILMKMLGQVLANARTNSFTLYLYCLFYSMLQSPGHFRSVVKQR